MKRIIILMLTLSSIICSPVLARDKIDKIWLSNGDRITGEIRQLEHGKLSVSTNNMGEVHIEWDNVVKIQSKFQFQFEKVDGQRIVAKIQDTNDRTELTLVNAEGTASIAHANIIRISQIEDSFWDRVRGSANFGFSFTKASDVAQLNLGIRATHRTPIRAFSIDSSIITTSDESDTSTQRSDLNLAMTRFRSNRWFSSYFLGFESNDELGLKLRASLGAGMGRFLIQSNTSELSLVGGLVGTAETLVGDVSAQENLEGLIRVEFSKFIFDDPSIDLTIRMSVFPSITESGRIRAQLDAKIRRELISDLYWDLTFYDTFDSDPPSGAAESKNDYGVVTSLGWSF